MSAMPGLVNREVINDRFKLAFHRLVARRIKENPAILEEARAIVRIYLLAGPQPDFVHEWAALLARSPADVRRAIVARSERMKWLRLSSPFRRLGNRVMDDAARMKLWRIVRKPFQKG